MTQREINNIRADQIADQYEADLRDGNAAINDPRSVVAGLRNLDPNDLPESCRDAGKELFRVLADERVIDARYHTEKEPT